MQSGEIVELLPEYAFELWIERLVSRVFVDNCRVLEFAAISDSRGTLTPFEAERSIPFFIRSVLCLRGVEPGELRWGCAYRDLHQLFVCVNGSVDITLDDGLQQMSFRLERPSLGLYIPAMIWHTARSIAPGSVCVVMASQYYDDTTCYRDYGKFIAAVNAARLQVGSMAP